MARQEETPLPLSLRLVSTLLTSANRLVRRKDYTINRWMANRLEPKVAANAKPVKGVFSKDVVVDAANKDVWVRVFVPCEQQGQEQQQQPQQLGEGKSRKYPAVVYYHGGGFAILSPDFLLYDIFCRRLARKAQCVVISVNYRRSPEHRHPTAHEDSYAVLKWLQSTDEPHVVSHADLSRCFLCGDSAGGNIVHHVGCRAAMEGLSPLCIRGHILIQPFFGGEERTPSEVRLTNVPVISVENADWHWKAYLPLGENRDHPTCNVFGPRSPDITRVPMPPSLVIVGEFDTLQDWQLRYAQGLTRASKQVEVLFYNGAVHAFHLFHRYQLSSQVLLDITKFVMDHC